MVKRRMGDEEWQRYFNEMDVTGRNSQWTAVRCSAETTNDQYTITGLSDVSSRPNCICHVLVSVALLSRVS